MDSKGTRTVSQAVTGEITASLSDPVTEKWLLENWAFTKTKGNSYEAACYDSNGHAKTLLIGLSYEAPQVWFIYIDNADLGDYWLGSKEEAIQFFKAFKVKAKSQETCEICHKTVTHEEVVEAESIYLDGGPTCTACAYSLADGAILAEEDGACE